MDSATKALYAKIASMRAIDVPAVQIAQVTGLSESRIAQITKDPEFQALLQEEAGQRFQVMKTLNDGWDMVEEHALNRVAEEVVNPMVDPDYALKVAMIANKAKRRGQLHERPIDGGMGSRAVITLNATFVNHLERNFELPAEGANNGRVLEQKRTDFLAPSAMERLLTGNVFDQERQRAAAEEAEAEAEIGALVAGAPA